MRLTIYSALSLLRQGCKQHVIRDMNVLHALLSSAETCLQTHILNKHKAADRRLQSQAVGTELPLQTQEAYQMLNFAKLYELGP